MTDDPPITPNEPDLMDRIARLREDSLRLVNEFHDWLTAKQIPWYQKCERHDQTLQIEVEASVRRGLALGGKFTVVYSDCPGCAADAKIRKRSEWLRKIGVEDENILHATFDNFIARTATDAANLQQVKEFAAVKRPRGFMMMIGGVGLGKSHLAVACLRSMEINAMFRTQGRMLMELRRGYNNSKLREGIIDQCSSVKMLVLDELGAGAEGRDVLPMLHEVLSTRHARQLPTIITTNLVPEQIEETVGIRVYDRMKQAGFANLEFSGESMRPIFRNKFF